MYVYVHSPLGFLEISISSCVCHVKDTPQHVCQSKRGTQWTIAIARGSWDVCRVVVWRNPKRKMFPFCNTRKNTWDGFGGTFFWTTKSVYQWSFCLFDCAFFLSCTWWFMSPYLLLVWIRSSAPRFNNPVLMGEITCFCFWDSLIIYWEPNFFGDMYNIVQYCANHSFGCC